MTHPPTTHRQSQPWIRVAAAVAIGGLFLAIWARAGWLALGLALALGLLLRGRRDRGRAMVELVAAGTLAVLLAGGPTPDVPKPPAVKVDAAQTDHLNQAREGVANLYAQLASGFSKYTKETP